MILKKKSVSLRVEDRAVRLFIFEMPKEKKEKSAILRSFVSEFGKNVFSTDGKILFCVPCEKAVTADSRFQVNQHLSTGKHQAAVLRSERSKQQLVPNQLENQGKIEKFSLKNDDISIRKTFT